MATDVQQETLLRVERLNVAFRARGDKLNIVKDVSFSLVRGKTLCVVGESGSGKTTLCMALLRLLPSNAEFGGMVQLAGEDLSKLSELQLSDIRGRRVGVIFQDPARALNPVLTIGRQIGEVLERHLEMPRHLARQRAANLLIEVGISDPLMRLQQYPHELSGGLKQRVMIAIAIACEPDLLIADEPTTALDVTIQRQVLRLLRKLSSERRLSVVLVTHDFGVVAGLADHVAVMYAGRIVEYGDVVEIFHRPRHPYTQALLSANPRRVLDSEDGMVSLEPIPGAPPSPQEKLLGCEFAPRCRHRQESCSVSPNLTELPHSVACWFPDMHR